MIDNIKIGKTSNGMKKTFLASLLSLSLFFIIGIVIVYAQPQQGGGQNPPQGGGSNPSAGKFTLDPPFRGGDSLFALLRTIIDKIILPIGGVLAVLSFIYAGFLYVTAQGNETKLKVAHKALLYTSVGTAVLLGSWVLAQVIEKTINQLR